MPDGASLYDLLLYRALDRFALDAHLDHPLDGDHAIIDALAMSETWDDPEFEGNVQRLQQQTKRRLEKAKETGSFDEEAVERAARYQHIGLIVRCLRKKGHLDRAPVVADEDSEAFLSGQA